MFDTLRPVRGRGRGLAVAGLLLALARPMAAQTTAPVPQANVAPPTMPDAALFAGIEGPATFRAQVDAAGRVTQVEVLSVPAAGHGFEDALRQAVRSWTFTPATENGAPVAAPYDGSWTFAPTLPGEFTFPVTSAAAWAATQALVRELKLSVLKEDQPQHMLVTRPGRYDNTRYPDGEALGLPPSATVRSIEWHLLVPPGFTTARVAVAAVTLVRRSDRHEFVRYHDTVLAHWFAARLGERLGHGSEPLSAGPTRRYTQSPLDRAAWGPGAAACPSLPQPAVARGFKPPGLVFARPLHVISPVFPSDAYRNRQQGAVTIAGTVTEHGTLSNISLLDGPDVEALRTASVTAASLWRFAPARLNGCPVMVDVTIQMSFALR